MSDNKFSFMLLEQNKSHIEDSSDFSENEYKNNDFKIQKYEKFKPKPNQDRDKNNKSLKGAENQVKNLLSVFLKNIESEDNSAIILKSNDISNNKDKEKDSISIRKQSILKINTAQNNNFVRTNSLVISSKDDKKNFSNKIFDNNRGFYGESTPKSNLFNRKLHLKKVAFNLNPININSNSNRNEIQKEGNYSLRKKNKKKDSLKNSNLFKNKKMNDILKRTNSYNIEFYGENKKSLMNENLKGNNIVNNQNKRENSTKSNLKIIRSIIKKTESSGQNDAINFKNDGYILCKNSNENKDFKKKKKNIFKNFFNNIYNMNISNKKNKNMIFNESIKNSILSENSESKINKHSIEMSPFNNKFDDLIRKERNSIKFSKIKKSETVVGHRFSTLFNKRTSVDLTDVSNKNSLIKYSVKPKKVSDLKNSLEIKNLKRSETTVFEKNFMSKAKFRRLNTHFKSLKEKIKKSIILRPEDIKISSDDEEKVSIHSINKKRKNSNKKRNSNILSDGIYKNKKGSKSNTNILSIKKFLNNINIGLISKKEISNKNKSNQNIRLHDINQFTEQTTSLKKINTETESQQTIKGEKKESSKSDSFEDYSVNSIKRKNTIFYEKYRILQHKGIVYDSLDDEEFDDQEEINSLYIDPNSNFSLTFDLIVFITTLISLFEVPLYLVLNCNFCRNKYFTLIDIINEIIELINIFDLFLGFFRAYYNWDEQLICKNKSIAKNYLTKWFFFDFLASIPIYTIIKVYEPLCIQREISTSCYYNVILDKIYYLLMCNRLFKLVKIFWNNQYWKILSNRLNENFIMTMNICLIFGAFNYTACLYIYVARNSYPNWILHTNLETQSFMNIYICAIYILIMALTTVGYGDITCYSMGEIIFQLLLLIVGIMAYSWLVSSFSNYIKKLNERTADLEKKKSILDEIKASNPNLPDELYERILRYLKFKNFHEKKLKTIIFDCLPVGLKNNLISEMYKPIIKNFIFFKNFQNTDFIVRVILAFKPILAYKNDILVNEGDMIEDIMFVKRGILSVELPINMTNPQENIDKYLNMPLLKIEKGPNVEKLGNTTIIEGKDQKIKNLTTGNKSLNNSESLKQSSSLDKINSFKYNLSLANKDTLREKKTIKIETTYVKILGIRENEHFGDVLMFLEQRSPLRVRVRSKKCELFFLKKMDAVKISTSYQNIWRRINKKSVFNFEQIKKSIRKIVQIYCSVKRISSMNDDEESDDLYGSQFGIKETGFGIHPQNYDLNNSALRDKKKIILKKCRSVKDEKHIDYNKFFQNSNLEDDYFQINSENIYNGKKYSSSRFLRKKLELNPINQNKIAFSSFSSSSSISSKSSSSMVATSKSYTKNKLKSKNTSNESENISNENNSKEENDNNNNINKKLLDVFNGNYKYYKKNNRNFYESKKDTIISEESEKDSTLPPLKYTNSIQKLAKVTTIKNRMINTFTKKSYLEEENCINENEEEDLKNKKSSYKSKNSSSIVSDNNNNIKENFSNLDENEEILSNKSSYNKEINIEIYPGEVIKVNKEENLLYKKINFNSDDEFNEFGKKTIEYKNSRLEKLLNSFDNDTKSLNSKKIKNTEININNNDNSNKNFLSDLKETNLEKNKLSSIGSSNILLSNKNNVINLKNNESSNNIPSPINTPKKNNWDSNNLFINNDISLYIESSYENYNTISGDLLIKNKSLQNKLKNYLIDESINYSRFNTNNNSNFIKKTNSFFEPVKFNGRKNIFQSSIRPDKKLTTSFIHNKNQINSTLLKKKTRKLRKTSSLMSKRSKTINSNTERFERSSSFYDTNIAKNKKGKGKFQTGIGSELMVNNFSTIGMANRLRRKKLSGKGLTLRSVNNISSIYNKKTFNNSSKELQKKIIKKRRNSLMIMSESKNGKKKDNLLSLISFNIQKTNQNLNNPDEFYNNYFASLLGEIEKKNQKNNNSPKFIGTPMIDNQKTKKEMRNKTSYRK